MKITIVAFLLALMAVSFGAVAQQRRPNVRVAHLPGRLHIDVNLAVLGRCDASPERAPDGTLHRGWVLVVQFAPGGFLHESQPGIGTFDEGTPRSWDGNYILRARCGSRFVGLVSSRGLEDPI